MVAPGAPVRSSSATPLVSGTPSHRGIRHGAAWAAKGDVSKEFERLISLHLMSMQGELTRELEAVVSEREAHLQELLTTLHLELEECQRSESIQRLRSNAVWHLDRREKSNSSEEQRKHKRQSNMGGVGDSHEDLREERSEKSRQGVDHERSDRGRRTSEGGPSPTISQTVSSPTTSQGIMERLADGCESQPVQEGLQKIYSNETAFYKRGGSSPTKSMNSVVCTGGTGAPGHCENGLNGLNGLCECDGTGLLPGVLVSEHKGPRLTSLSDDEQSHRSSACTSAQERSNPASMIRQSEHFDMWPAWKAEQNTFADRMVPTRSSVASDPPPICFPGPFSKEIQETIAKTSTSYMPTGIIHPASISCCLWNILFMAVLVYELISLPLRCFDLPEGGALWVLSVSCVAFWSCDLVFSCSVGYYTKDGKLVMNRSLIITKYLRSWLMPDMLIVGLDWFFIAYDNGGDGEGDSSLEGLTSMLRIGKALRYVRVLRVLRLLRLRKLGESLAVLDEFVSSEYFSILQNVCCNMIGILVISHFLGCFWFLVGSVKVDGWPSWVEAYGLHTNDWGYQYVTSLHWSLTQITPGSMEIQPQNMPERVFAVMVLIFGIIVFSSIVSSITSAVNNLKSIGARYERQRGLLRRFFREQKVSKQLVSRVTRYSDNILRPQQKKVGSKEVELLRLLPASLYMEVMLEIFGQDIRVHPLFEAIYWQNRAVMQKVCCALEHANIPKDDVLFIPGESAQAISFITRGTFLYNIWQSDNTMVHTGQWFCEPVLWTPWVHQGSMESTADSELVTLDSDKFQDVVQHHRSDMWLIKKYCTEYVRKMNELATSSIGPAGPTSERSGELAPGDGDLATVSLSDLMTIESAVKLLDIERLKRNRPSFRRAAPLAPPSPRSSSSVRSTVVSRKSTQDQMASRISAFGDDDTSSCGPIPGTVPGMLPGIVPSAPASQ